MAELEFYDLSALYIVYSSHYIHTFRMYRGKKEETKIGYRETWNSTTATLVLLRARSTAPIHGIAMLRPHPKDKARKVVPLLHDTPHLAKLLVLEPGTPSSSVRASTTELSRLPKICRCLQNT